METSRGSVVNRSNIFNNTKKIYLRRLPLSRFLAKTLKVNKIAMKSVSKQICRSESTLDCRSPRHSCIKLTHTTYVSCVRNYVVILTKGLLWPIIHICLRTKKKIWNNLWNCDIIRQIQLKLHNVLADAK